MIDLKLESQGIWVANLADEYAFKIELVGSPEISIRQRFKLASRIAKCVSAMAGIGDDNTLFAPGNSVRSVISSMKLKELELEQQRDELLAALRSAVETIEWMHGCSSPASDEVEEAIREGNAAIAKAEAVQA